jgi:hypothetical protein
VGFVELSLTLASHPPLAAGFRGNDAVSRAIDEDLPMESEINLGIANTALYGAKFPAFHGHSEDHRVEVQREVFGSLN